MNHVKKVMKIMHECIANTVILKMKMKRLLLNLHNVSTLMCQCRYNHEKYYHYDGMCDTMNMKSLIVVVMQMMNERLLIEQ